jgi:hypothetical protein
MKKLLLLLMFSMPVFAQQKQIELYNLSRDMKCAKVEDLIGHLVETYDEKMMWVGKDENNSSYVSIYKNKETGTWTLIQYGSSIGCVLSSGTQGSPV